MGERSILFSGMTVCALLDSRANDEIRTRPMEARPPDCIQGTLRTMALSITILMFISAPGCYGSILAGYPANCNPAHLPGV
jgi:hypothetical protein